MKQTPNEAGNERGGAEADRGALPSNAFVAEHEPDRAIVSNQGRFAETGTALTEGGYSRTNQFQTRVLKKIGLGQHAVKT